MALAGCAAPAVLQLLRRAAKGKRTSNNSGNFVALDVLGVGRSIVDRGEPARHLLLRVGSRLGTSAHLPQ